MTTIYPVLKGLTEPGARTEAQLDLIEARAVRGVLPGLEMRSYIPATFFGQDHADAAWSRLVDLLNLRSEYPEVSYAWVSSVVEGLMGIVAGSPVAPLITQAGLPEAVEWCELDSLPLAGHRIGVRQERSGRTIVSHHEGPGPLMWHARFAGTGLRLDVDGAEYPVQGETVGGRGMTCAMVTVPVGATVAVRASSEES
jgi:hypothetical protein